MSASDAALKIIRNAEGLKLTPYKDAGLLAIGYGHRLKNKKIKKITPAHAENLLKSDVGEVEKRIRPLLSKSRIRQHQYDALVSFTYNVGPDKAKNVIKYASEGKHDKVKSEMNRFVHSEGKKLGGLVNRRKSETDLYTAPNKVLEKAVLRKKVLGASTKS